MKSTIFLIVLFGMGLAGDQKQKDQAMMKDEELIQGNWELESGERHGKAFPESVVAGIRLQFSKDELSTINKDRVNKAKFTLHQETQPKGIDLDMEGSIGKGIYQLDKDTLTILHGEVGDERPTKFDPKQTPRLTLLVLKRMRKAE